MARTSVKFDWFIGSASSPIGEPFPGLTSATTGLEIWTKRNDEATWTKYKAFDSSIEDMGAGTIGTYLAPTSGKIRFAEIDGSGWYHVQVADARCSSGDELSFHLVCPGAVTTPKVIDLQARKHDAQPELTTSPGPTASELQMLKWLFMESFNPNIQYGATGDANAGKRVMTKNDNTVIATSEATTDASNTATQGRFT